VRYPRLSYWTHPQWILHSVHPLPRGVATRYSQVTLGRTYYLARAACLPRGLFSAYVIFFILVVNFSPRNLGSTVPILTKFSSCDRYLVIDYLSDLFPIDQGTLPWLYALQNELVYRHADACINRDDDLSISCEDLVNYGLVTPEFTKVA